MRLLLEARRVFMDTRIDGITIPHLRRAANPHATTLIVVIFDIMRFVGPYPAFNR